MKTIGSMISPSIFGFFVFFAYGFSPSTSIHYSSQINDNERLVPMTLVANASSYGAVCLDGSSPAYNFDKGYQSGLNNWLLQIEGGGWCVDVKSCIARARNGLGSSNFMSKYKNFSGILSNDVKSNPDFYNWNRVILRYCDGGSFGGDSEYKNGSTLLQFRGKKIFDAIIKELKSKGLLNANKVLLSGCSAGGLATFIHCDNLANQLPKAKVKCMSDAGFFLNAIDVSGKNSIGQVFNNIVQLQGVQRNLLAECVSSQRNPVQCFFPQVVLPYIKTPYFILNSAYDITQFYNIFVPSSADPHGQWRRCKKNLTNCSANQINVLHGYRSEMLSALKPIQSSSKGGMFINSCFAHCQAEIQHTWFAPNSPRINNKSIAETVGDWYFERNEFKEEDCPYPCDNTCHNLIPSVV